jgi:hypothetical protein
MQQEVCIYLFSVYVTRLSNQDPQMPLFFSLEVRKSAKKYWMAQNLPMEHRKKPAVL